MDNIGTIDYGEFVAAMIHLNKLEREAHLVAMLQYFDKDVPVICCCYDSRKSEL